jgi:capsid protein
MAIPQAIRDARQARDLAQLAFQTELLKRRTAIVSKYDATESSTMRRQPVREMTGEDSIYDQRKRVLGTNIGRDLERNYSPARGMLHQFRMNVVGALGKIQVNTDGGGDEAADWFNGEWAKDCDYRDPGIHFSEQMQNIVASVLREGDALGVFDDGLIDGGAGSGKVLHWEADQIAPLSEAALAAKGYKGSDYTQENGIIRGKWGRVVAYVVTGKHGLSVIDTPEDATVFKADDARLVKNPWRLNQGRGVPAMITSATNILDLYEILGKELISAKRATQIAGFVERSDAVTDWDTPTSGTTHLPENSDKTAATVAAEGANDTTDNSALNYERFEALTGGIFEYGAKGDKMTFPEINRPNVHLPEFIEAVLGYAGSSLGLARAYTILRADSSYTAFRGDMILTWAGAFYPMQKWLERQYADWVAVKALTWAQRQKKIKPLADGWARRLSWQWPTMPHVDEAREEAATENALRNGTTDYSQLLGPGWRTKFDALAEQLDVARAGNIPLSVFTMKSGGAVTPDEQKTPEQKKKEDEETA